MKWSRNWISILFFCTLATGACRAATLSGENNLAAIDTIVTKVLKVYPGRLESISVEKHRGPLVYELEVVNPGTGMKSEIHYNTATERMVLDEKDKLRWNAETKQFTDKKYRQLVTSPVTLMAATRKVMEEVPGKLNEAELKHSRQTGQIFFEIEVVTSTSIVKKFVDVQTGQFIAPVVDD